MYVEKNDNEMGFLLRVFYRLLVEVMIGMVLGCVVMLVGEMGYEEEVVVIL